MSESLSPVNLGTQIAPCVSKFVILCVTSVPENSKPVAAGTVICTTFNEAHDDDKGNELDGDNSDKVGSKKADN